MEKPLILEQHIHGAFGVDFNTATVDEVLYVADKLAERGIVAFFPTLVTDSIENLKQQISVIKEAGRKCKRIVGIHLEGVFINSRKKGIHNSDCFLPLTVENYKLIEDDFIKIVTLAPELDEGLIGYLKEKGIKVQAGHCVGWGDVDGVTHLFNAMKGINHRESSTALSALVDENVYVEVIADGVHLSDDILKLVFKTKAKNKIILVSDALPITNSEKKECVFAGSKIFYDGKQAVSAEGTIAGSTMLLDKIIERLKNAEIFNPQYIENVWNYHELNPEDFSL